MFESLYDVTEQAQVNFIGFATERARYDFAIVYTKHFFGKLLVVCMQTNQSSLLDGDDLTHFEHLQKAFRLNRTEAEELSLLLQKRLPAVPAKDQY